MTQGADQWVSAWPRYFSNEQGCTKLTNTTHSCNVPLNTGGQQVAGVVVIDTEQNTITFDAIDGGVPWVRVNLLAQGNKVNQKYDADNLPVYVPGELNDNPMIFVEAVLEMAHSEPIRR